MTHRVGKACEGCRVRRRRCDGAHPCSTCVKAGTTSTCFIRAKSRPKRAVPAELQAQVSPTIRQRRFLCDEVDADLSLWAVTKGSGINLSLSSSSSLSPYLLSPLPPVPGSYKTRRLAIDAFIATYLPSISPVKPGIWFVDCLERVETAWTLALPLVAVDEQGLLFAAICLGSLVDSTLKGHGSSATDTAFYRLALQSVDLNIDQPSLLSLGALQLLYLFISQHGGPLEIRSIVDRMVRILRSINHRRLDCDEEDVLKFLVQHTKSRDTETRSHDSCFATVFDGEALMDIHPGDLLVDIQSRDHTKLPSFVELTILENEIMRSEALAPQSAGNGPAASHVEIANALAVFEARLHSWRRDWHAGQLKGEKHPMMSFAVIRYHWLRLMLRYPLFHHPVLAHSSQTIVCQAASRVVATYWSMRGITVLRPTWAETRRIVTASRILLMCYIGGELPRAEFMAILPAIDGLLEYMKTGCEAAVDAAEKWRVLLRLAGLDDPPMTAGDDDLLSQVFNYSFEAG